MKKISRILIFSALTLALLAACTGQEGSPTAAGTTIPGDETATPFPVETDTTGTAETAVTSPEATLDTTATVDLTGTAPATADTTQTPGVPVTGADVILLECQFCIEGMAHALLVLPDTATFEAVADTASLATPGPDTGCNTMDTYNGRQIVLCRSAENTSLNLNICVDGNNCTQLLVELQACPVTGTPQPGATNTLDAGVPTITVTPGVGVPTSTPIAITDTPTAAGSPTATP